MNRRSAGTQALPAPKSPFASWFGAACVGLWAVGVQALGSPWQQALALLSPGLGYVAGHGAELAIVKYIQKPQVRQNELLRAERLKKFGESVELIEAKIENLKASNAPRSAIQPYEKLLADAHKRIAEEIGASLRE